MSVARCSVAQCGVGVRCSGAGRAWSGRVPPAGRPGRQARRAAPATLSDKITAPPAGLTSHDVWITIQSRNYLVGNEFLDLFGWAWQPDLFIRQEGGAGAVFHLFVNPARHPAPLSLQRTPIL